MNTEQNKELKKNPVRGMTPERRKRINRLKKMIMYAVLLMILLPVTGCIFLGVKLYRTNRTVEAMAGQIGYLERALQDSVDAADRAEALLEINEGIWKGSGPEQDPGILQEPAEASGDAAAEADGVRKVYLTFDDGPSIYTEELLDILEQYDVKATFFVIGKGKEEYGDTYRRIVEDGHTLGMHSYSHEYSNVYASLGSFQEDLELLRNFLYNETGVISNFYRFPGGSSNKVSRTDIHEMTAYLDAMGISYFDWNISAGDATSVPVSSDQIVNRVMSQIPSYHAAVVLMHDAGDKRSTVDALPKLIERIKALEDETVILPITEETVPVQHIQSEKN